MKKRNGTLWVRNGQTGIKGKVDRKKKHLAIAVGFSGQQKRLRSTDLGEKRRFNPKRSRRATDKRAQSWKE